MQEIINRNKDGKIIRDLSAVRLPYQLEAEIFRLLNPGMEIKEGVSK
jgi:hypothetical protein